ncbi:MAG TPA: HPP family protein [Longimicrobium sp.]|jgi:CBS-domain-containing membrane protein
MQTREAGAELDSPLQSVAEAAWTPLVTALLVLLPGLVGLAIGRPTLFPSLGPTALLQARTPDHPSTRFYNVVVAHLIGLGSAFLMVTIFGIAHARSAFEVGELSWSRVLAASLAVGLSALVDTLLRAPHPPSAATTLLASLGAFHPSVRDTVTFVIGVLIVAVAGELCRHLRLRGVDSPRARDGVRS